MHRCLVAAAINIIYCAKGSGDTVGITIAIGIYLAGIRARNHINVHYGIAIDYGVFTIASAKHLADVSTGNDVDLRIGIHLRL